MPNSRGSALITKYRNLVQAEASLRNLDASIALAEEASGVRVAVPWQIDADRIAIDDEKQRQYMDQARLSVYLSEYVKDRIEENQIPRRRSRERIRLQLRTYRAAGVLALPEFIHPLDRGWPAKRISLIIDTAIVVAHQAYFALLPRITEQRLEQERRVLLGSIISLARIVRSSDGHRLRALVYEASGDPLLAESALRDAVGDTPETAHEFMTVLQSAWAYMLENGRPKNAMLLLLDNASRVPERHMEEFHEFIQLTVDAARSAA